ncbi:MAG: glycerol-3-phosphate dehydrogenase/oxidase [Chitinophagales bacterium]|nr:glycerol-3-phosphate dehydrogenase/oxidase [Chitinophagales bacterium]
MVNKQILSTFQRDSTIEQLSKQGFDLLVIGGGITGAGIALDAASRGMKVALVEKKDFASGTSSKSTKLIHGGLRYLKQFEIALVKEVGRERAILHRNAPHVVVSENMLLPIVENGSLGRTSTAIGLSVYDWLAGVRFSEWKDMLSKYATLKKEPLLRSDNIKGGAIYKEYRTDDARLVLEVLKTAAHYGARCINYTEVDDLLYAEGKVSGADVTDIINKKKFSIRAKKVINAAGPWVDALRRKDNSLKGKTLHLTKGVHLVVPYEKLPVRQSAYFDVADGRMIFVIPRGEITYIGTTDTNYDGDIENPVTAKEDVAYLLAAVNSMFPTVELTKKDITSSWAGLRPLIHEEGKDPSELSRKDEIFISPSGLISMAGGKLTGFRKMAERAVDTAAYQIASDEGLEFKRCFTDKIILGGGDFKDEYSIAGFAEKIEKMTQPSDITTKDIFNLIHRYGTACEKIIKAVKEQPTGFSNKALLLAELDYCIAEEAVTNLSDFFIRRTGKLYFEREVVEQEYQFLKEKAGVLFGWNEEQKQRNHAEFMQEYHAVVMFK